MTTQRKGKTKTTGRRRAHFPGVVYLAHLEEKFKGTQHYLGYSKTPRSLTRRLWHHRNGTGAKYLKAVVAAGIEFSVVRTWRGGKLLERVLKERHEAPRLCPACCEQQGREPLPARYTDEELRAAYDRYQARLVRKLLAALEVRERARMEALIERERAAHAIASICELR